MAVPAEMLDDAKLLVGYAFTHSIALPNNTADVLLAATANAAAIATPGQAQNDFLGAFAAATTAIGQSASSLRAITARRIRMRQKVDDAQVLLSFAAANGVKVEDAVRNPVVAINAAMDDESLTVEQEQEFLKAYEGLTVALAPITVETLRASQTILPNWTALWSASGWKKLEHWSFGRFFNVSVFILVLIGTCISLNYYSQGAAALGRFKELQAILIKSKQELPAKIELTKSRGEAVALEEKKTNPDPSVLAEARRAAFEADAAVKSADEAKVSAAEELSAIPGRLQHWASLPCDKDANFVFRLVLCSKVDQPQTEAQQRESNPLMMVEAARTVSTRLNDVYLPLLLGWLGAHAFILRRMSKDISERAFAPGSAFNHIVRNGLGALAGLASSWLLTPQAVGGAQWANLPVWALAFVAGYGIELVFAFMDRIIGAFTSK